MHREHHMDIMHRSPCVDPSYLSTVNMHADVLPPLGLAPPPPSLHHSPFGPPDTSYSPRPPTSNDFLSPDIGATSLRRSESDGIRRAPGFGHRQVRSEDYRFSSSLPATTFAYPPPGPSSFEFINRNISSQQSLHPTQVLPSIVARGSHHRRSSSGSRERPHGYTSGPNSARASPYPSSNASPRPGYGPLPASELGGIGPIMPRRSMGVDPSMMSGVMDQDVAFVLPGTNEIMIVAKQNVTTPSTADASQKRRKQPANLKCPIPGCGGTFTHNPNLKGHLRSHAEQKPYTCKWPGCQKDFARQHDCKRHEQLHLNIRPYPCEGCKKNFARMDALNRHLRSEGGAECRKIQKEIPLDDTMPLPSLSVDPVMSSVMDQGGDLVLSGTGGVVAEQIVTTPNTMDASHKSQKQLTNFKCPMPDCGSTFTRRFNLEGHLRSHEGQKPYTCGWPECKMGFARKHDRNRHERSHSNDPVYSCEGCKKNFARMDAINRHLRSAACRKSRIET